MEEKTEFTFKELSEDAQESAVEAYNFTDFEWWDFTIDEWKERLEAMGFNDPDIGFSGFSSQGDGASFTAWVDNEKMISTLMYCGESFEDVAEFQSLIEMTPNLAEMLGIQDDNYDLSITLTRRDHHYFHENTITVEVEAHEMFYEKADRYGEAVNSLRKSLCRELYKDLEAEYNWMASAEYFAETAEANNWLFDEYGVMIK